MIKILIITVSIIIAAGAALFILTRAASSPLTREQAEKKIQDIILREVDKNESVTGALVMLGMKESGIDRTFTAGTARGKPIMPDQPFHIASIGKAFTAAIAGTLVDEGLLSLDDPISAYLPAEMLKGLFTVDGMDYSAEVTVSMLLNHTSGIADYFDGPVTGGTPLRELIMTEPNRFWTPEDLLDYSRSRQKPVAGPGEKFSYSDTGYILLGLLLEKASGKAFHELLHQKIFTPLSMDDSYLMFYSKPLNEALPIAEVWLEGQDISGFQSLSIDWTGGGIISTLHDLELFVKALSRGDILKPETLSRLWTFDRKFMRGIHYGYGFMEYHFGEFFPTLSAYPLMRGHMGILGTQMFYDDESGTLFIASFGSADYSAGSVKTMIKILGTAGRVRQN